MKRADAMRLASSRTPEEGIRPLATEASAAAASASVPKWRSHLPFAAVLLASLPIVLVYMRSWVQVAELWSDFKSRYSHGWLIVGASLFVLFQNLPSRVSWSHPRHRWLGCAVGALASLLWLFGDLLSVESVAQFAALIVLMAALHAVFGRPISRVTDRCVAVLGLALPLWDTMNVPFQKMTIVVVGAAVRLLGLPAQFDGPLVILPAGRFEIELGCNGLQLFLAAVTTGALLTSMRGDRWLDSARILVGAALVGLFANWIRVTTVIVVGHLTDMQNYLVKSEHYTLGWSVFAVGIAAYVFWVSHWPVRASGASEQAGARLAGPPPRGAWVSVLVMMAVPALAAVASIPPPAAARADAARFRSADWSGPVSSWSEWATQAVGAQRLVVADYLPRGGGPRVSVFLARYASPEHVGQTLLSVTGFLPAPDWASGGSVVQAAPWAGRAPTSVRRAIATDPTGIKWVFVYWYQVGERTYNSAARARLAFTAGRLGGGSGPFALVVLGSVCAENCESEIRMVNALAAQAGPGLTAQILE